jgi:hypothetical protein
MPISSADPNKGPCSLKEKIHNLYITLSAKKSLIPHCMSIALGCCIVTYIWLLTGWPGGVCAGISALVVGADSSLTKINLKIRLRLVGSLLGCALGLVLYVFFIQSTLSLCIIVFLGVALFTYLSQKDFSWMYVSWMATMGFVITVVPDTHQITDISFSFERAFGLIMGLVVMAFVVNFFWPLNYQKQFQEVCDTMKKKAAIIWSLLGSLTLQNNETVMKEMDSIHQQILLQMNEGSTIAKSNQLMPTWMPIIDAMVIAPWVKNHSTSEALAYLNTQYPDRWTQYCQETNEAIMGSTSSKLLSIKQQWGKWANQLHTADQDKKTVAQCWLMLQTNEHFCNALAKTKLYTSDL